MSIFPIMFILRTFFQDFFSETKFSETETLKKLAKVSKLRSFETEMSISGRQPTKQGKIGLLSQWTMEGLDEQKTFSVS